jgi:hypothetical protein
MAFNWTQGSAPPPVDITQSQKTTAPEFYTDYLKEIGKAGEGFLGANAPKYIGEQALQTEAFDQAKGKSFGAQNYLDQASRLGGLSGATTTQQLEGYQVTDPTTGQKVTMGGGYMNPYIKDVVSEIERLGQRQLQEALPSITGAAVGSGGFGSQRALQSAGIVGRDVLADILGKQTGALASGYDAATKAAQTDLARYLQGAGVMGGLGQIASGTNIAELQNLASLGAQQQAIEQGEENFPLQTAQAVSGLLRGYTMPTETASTYKGPLAGLQYSPSGLQTLGSIAGLFAPTGSSGQGISAAQGLINAGKGLVDSLKNMGLFSSDSDLSNTGNIEDPTWT